MLKECYAQGFALGKKFGLVKGIKMWTDQSGDGGAIGVIMIFAGVLVTLYLSAMILGVFSNSAINGMSMSSRWNTTVIGLDTSAASSFSLANVLPIAILCGYFGIPNPYRAKIGTGVLGVVIAVMTRE